MIATITFIILIVLAGLQKKRFLPHYDGLFKKVNEKKMED